MSASFRCSTDIKTFKDFKQNVTYFGESRIGWHDEPLLFFNQKAIICNTGRTNILSVSNCRHCKHVQRSPKKWNICLRIGLLCFSPPLIVTWLLLRDIIRVIDRGIARLDQLLPPSGVYSHEELMHQLRTVIRSGYSLLKGQNFFPSLPLLGLAFWVGLTFTGRRKLSSILGNTNGKNINVILIKAVMDFVQNHLTPCYL